MAPAHSCLQRLSAKCKSSLALIMVRTWTSRGRATSCPGPPASPAALGLGRGRSTCETLLNAVQLSRLDTAYISLETRDMSRQSSRPILPEGEIFLIWNPSPPDFGLRGPLGDLLDELRAHFLLEKCKSRRRNRSSDLRRVR